MNVTTMPTAWGAPAGTGVLRASPEDFRVAEVMAFAPTGDGEHVWLRIRKRGANTQYVAELLAEWAGVGVRDVGYAGLKDRHAVTDQWFSLYLPGRKMPPWRTLEQRDDCELNVLMATRHRKKLARGAHAGNQFEIRISDVQLDGGSRLCQLLDHIAQYGVPNAFGPQRFGINGGNLAAADRWFVDGRRPKARHQRGLILSAARSWLFNEVLAERVRAGSWRTCLVGEWATQTRAGEAIPTGPLFGRGASYAQGLPGAIENSVAKRYPQWLKGLDNAGLSLNRRRLCSVPRELTWTLHEHALDLSFYLPRGEYATTVLAACLELVDASTRSHQQT